MIGSVAMDALYNCMEDLERLDLLDVVGRLYLGQGKYREADTFLNECFDKRTSILGENHPVTLASMHNLTGLYGKQGHYDKALPLYITCLEQRKLVECVNCNMVPCSRMFEFVLTRMCELF
jgi:tetratricopeptide (TPR) repeat protein